MRRGFLSAFLVVLAGFFTSVPAWADLAKGATPAAVEWKAGDTSYLAGRDITVDRKIDGALTVTGETITLTRDAKIANDVWIAGRRVATEADIGGDLSLRAQDALINGHVKGDVTFYGVHLAFGPDAVVDGNVNYYAAGPAEIDSGAHIAGNMRSKVWDRDTRPIQPEEGRRARWEAPGYRLSWPGAIVFGFIAGIIALSAPEATTRLGEVSAAQPALAFLIGLVWLVGAPIAAVVSAVTIIGLPIAFIMILLWLVGMLIGLVVTIIALGQVFTGRMRPRYEHTARVATGIAVATVLLWVGISLPALGGLVWFAAVTFGIGALVLSARVV